MTNVKRLSQKYLINNIYMKKKTIIFAWGGTWGHVFPIESVISYIHWHFSDHVHKMQRFGELHSLEHERASALQIEHGIPLDFIPIKSGKFRREKARWAMLQNMRDLVTFFQWLLSCYIYFFTHPADVVFCKWWHVALPVVFAARAHSIPIVVHESDTKPWLVNRIAGKFATQNFSWFPDVLPDTQVVGQLLSGDMIQDTENKELLDFLDTHQDKTKILVVWGSQWSQSLYTSLAWVLEQIPPTPFLEGEQKVNSRDDVCFIIWLWRLNTEMTALFADMPHVYTADFFDKPELGTLMRSCDAAITRGGTTFLSELKLFGLKLCIVPIPWTHDQAKNAAWYVEHHGDISLDQYAEDFDAQLSHTVQELSIYTKPETHVDLETLEKWVEIVSKYLIQ